MATILDNTDIALESAIPEGRIKPQNVNLSRLSLPKIKFRSDPCQNVLIKKTADLNVIRSK